MTTQAELGITLSMDADRVQPPRTPAMQSYCRTLSRFTTAVQSTEQLLRTNEMGEAEERERREIESNARLHTVAKAESEARGGAEQSATTREKYGLGPGNDDPAQQPQPAHVPNDLSVALTALARRRETLRAAETEFDEWQTERDEQSYHIVMGSAVAVGLLGVIIMIMTAGPPLTSGSTLGLILLCSLAVAGVACVVAVVRRLPQVCVGEGLARIPDVASLVKLGSVVAAVAAGVLLAVRFLAGIVM